MPKRKKTNEEFANEVKVLTGGEYKVVGEYTGSLKEVKMRHVKCGCNFWVTPNKFLTGRRRCPACTAVNLSIYNSGLTSDKYGVIKTGNGVKNGVMIVCKCCGSIFKPDASAAKGKINCPYCHSKEAIRPAMYFTSHTYFADSGVKISCGAKIVLNTLKSLNAKFVSEYKIPECKNIKPLPFDFAVFDDDELIGLIEYDGAQHERAVPYFGGEKAFKGVQMRDKIKTEYCLNHGIPLLRINSHDDEKAITNKVTEFIDGLTKES